MKKSTSKLTRKVLSIPGLDWILLGIGLVVFVLLVLHSISSSSIWFDEAFSAYISKFDFVQIAQYTAADVHPPFYYWVLKIWTSVFGTTELAFRSLSLLFGTTAITFGYLLVRRLFGRHSAWLTLLLLVLSPMLIRYSQEARMYTMAATFALSATYVLTIAMESKKRRMWVLYGILVSLGMWTHYFTAMVWLTHWAWRAVIVRQSGKRGKKFIPAFFTKDWIIAHIVAVGLFLPWLPFMAIQLASIQGTGFWISPVTANTLTNYLTNVLMYLEHVKVLGWFAVLFVLVVVLLGYLSIRLYKSLNKKQRQSYLLVIMVAFVPVLLLFVVSLPPLKSSFVDRYLVPSAASFSLFAGVTLALGTRYLTKTWRVVIIGLVAGSMLFGIYNVYQYGNYNRNGSGGGESILTGEVVQEIAVRAHHNEPIIVASPWAFYEAVFYNTTDHPVYFVEADTQYDYGSLKMLQDNDQYKIKDLPGFVQKHPVIWYVGGTPNQTVSATWQEMQRFTLKDPISGRETYGAIQYQTN